MARKEVTIMLCKLSTTVDLETIIDHLPVAVIVVDRERRILLANEMATRFAATTQSHYLGLRPGEYFGCVESKTYFEGCVSGSACDLCISKQKVLETFANRSGVALVECVMHFADKGKRTMRISTTYLGHDSQNGEHVIVALEDITEARKQEETRLMNQKLVAAIETAGAVCHEMNQPLQAMAGALDLTMLDIEADIDRETLKGKVRKVQSEVFRLGHITKKLMNIRQYQTKKYMKGKILDIERATGNGESENGTESWAHEMNVQPFPHAEPA
jgi:nitrogen fixation/metabolism regulation signal transduction histidine kinase